MLAFSTLALLSCVVLSFSEPTSASLYGTGQSHRRVANALTGRVDRRAFSGGFTWYDVGLGACGKSNQAGEYVVALNQALFSGGSHCFETVTITANGKSTQAQIVDECMGCGPNDLDFSSGLFQFFAELSAGEVYGSWEFGSGTPTPKPSTSSEPPSTTSTTPKSTSSPSSSVPSTSTSTPTPTPTPTPTSTSTSSSTPTPTPTSSPSQTTWSSAAPTPTIPSDFIAQLGLAFGNIGELVIAGENLAAAGNV